MHHTTTTTTTISDNNNNNNTNINTSTTTNYCFQPYTMPQQQFPIIQENQLTTKSNEQHRLNPNNNNNNNSNKSKPSELKFKIESVGIQPEEDDDLDMCPARTRPNWPKQIIPWWTASHPTEKPPYSYATLIAHAILSSKDGRLTLNDIYNWIAKTYPSFSVGTGGWQNSIRHNLSLNKKWFCKIDRRPTQANPGKGCYWTLLPGTEQIFIDNLTQEGGHSRKHHDIGLTTELSVGQRRGACYYRNNSTVPPPSNTITNADNTLQPPAATPSSSTTTTSTVTTAATASTPLPASVSLTRSTTINTTVTNTTAMHLDTPPSTPPKPDLSMNYHYLQPHTPHFQQHYPPSTKPIIHSPLYTSFCMVDMAPKSDSLQYYPTPLMPTNSSDDNQSDRDSGVDVSNEYLAQGRNSLGSSSSATVNQKHGNKRRRLNQQMSEQHVIVPTQSTAFSNPISSFGYMPSTTSNAAVTTPYEVNHWVEQQSMFYTECQQQQPPFYHPTSSIPLNTTTATASPSTLLLDHTPSTTTTTTTTATPAATWDQCTTTPHTVLTTPPFESTQSPFWFNAHTTQPTMNMTEPLLKHSLAIPPTTTPSAAMTVHLDNEDEVTQKYLHFEEDNTHDDLMLPPSSTSLDHNTPSDTTTSSSNNNNNAITPFMLFHPQQQQQQRQQPSTTTTTTTTMMMSDYTLYPTYYYPPTTTTTNNSITTTATHQQQPPSFVSMQDILYTPSS